MATFLTAQGPGQVVAADKVDVILKKDAPSYDIDLLLNSLFCDSQKQRSASFFAC